MRDACLVGSYIGNGTDNRWITLTDTTVTPAFVFVQNTSLLGSGGALSMNNLIGSSWYVGSRSNPIIGLIKDIGLGSFQVGTDNEVNVSNGSYYYVVLGSNTLQLQMGSYFGDGTSARTISTTFPPKWVVIASKTNSIPIQKIGGVGSEPIYFGHPLSLSGSNILYLKSTGFAVSNGSYTNDAAGSYYWMAAFGDSFEVGSFVGTDTSNIQKTVGSAFNTGKAVLVKAAMDPNVVGSMSTQTPYSSLLRKLLHYWPLNETSAGSDVYGTNHGSQLVGVTLDNGVQQAYLGSAYKMNAGVTGSYFGFAPKSFPVGSTSTTGTWSIWVKPYQTGLSGQVWMYSSSGEGTSNFNGWGTGGVQLMEIHMGVGVTAGAGKAGCFYQDSSTSTNGSIHAGSLSTTTWTHVVMTYDTAGNMELYTNGSLGGTLSLSGQTSFNSPINSYIGRCGQDAGTTRPGSGVFTQAGVWTRVLNGDEIKLLYNDGSGLKYPFTRGHAIWNTNVMLPGSTSFTQGSESFLTGRIGSLSTSGFYVGLEANN